MATIKDDDITRLVVSGDGTLVFEGNNVIRCLDGINNVKIHDNIAYVMLNKITTVVLTNLEEKSVVSTENATSVVDDATESIEIEWDMKSPLFVNGILVTDNVKEAINQQRSKEVQTTEDCHTKQIHVFERKLNLHEVIVSGGSSVSLTKEILQSSISLTHYGTGSIDIQADSLDKIKAYMFGSGNILGKTRFNRCYLRVFGSGHIYGFHAVNSLVVVVVTSSGIVNVSRSATCSCSYYPDNGLGIGHIASDVCP